MLFRRSTVPDIVFWYLLTLAVGDETISLRDVPVLFVTEFGLDVTWRCRFMRLG